MTTAEQQKILDEARKTLRGRPGGSVLRDFSEGERNALASWSALKRAREEQEPPAAASSPEPGTAPIDWPTLQAWLDSHMSAAIAAEHAWWIDEALPQLIAMVQDEASVELSLDVRRLNAEIAELRALIGEAQAILRADRAERGIHVPDVPKPAKPVN
jgi:hypothetical protein